MRRSLHPFATSILLVVAASLLAIGCGGGSSSKDDAKDAGAGALVHVDGAIKKDGDAYVVTPAKGGDPITFTLGADVQGSEVLALAAAGKPARVAYRLSEDDPVAVSVEPAPEFGDDVKEYVGEIEDVSSSKIVLDGSDGERTFAIASEFRSAFDQPHLKDHRRAGTPVRVYYRGDDAAVAYEDA